MRYTGVLLVFLLGGCFSVPSLQQLEDQALVSGDWSDVEKRERVIARRLARQGPKCETGSLRLCRDYGVNDRCVCVKPDRLSVSN